MCVLNRNSELFYKLFHVSSEDINSLLLKEPESDINYCLQNDLRSKKFTDTELDYLLNCNYFCKCDHTYTSLHACTQIPYECEKTPDHDNGATKIKCPEASLTKKTQDISGKKHKEIKNTRLMNKTFLRSTN